MPQRKKGMLALTGSGDDGTSALLGGVRVPKYDLRLEAYGTVDEASSALGLAKALCRTPRLRQDLEEVQRGLYRLGAELATPSEAEGKFGRMEKEDVDRLEALTSELEADAPMPTGFVLPGGTSASAALDLARTIVRRAERRTVELSARGEVPNPEVLRYLNRLSLLLFVAARFQEQEEGVAAPAARSSTGTA